MERKPFSWINAVIIGAGIVSFLLGFIPSINEEWRTILLLSSPALLAIACLFICLSNQDEILEQLKELEEKLKRAEDLINLRADIVELKRRVK